MSRKDRRDISGRELKSADLILSLALVFLITMWSMGSIQGDHHEFRRRQGMA